MVENGFVQFGQGTLKLSLKISRWNKLIFLHTGTNERKLTLI